MPADAQAGGASRPPYIRDLRRSTLAKASRAELRALEKRLREQHRLMVRLGSAVPRQAARYAADRLDRVANALRRR